MGKITIIKTLALPKLIHLLTALPNLPESKLNELNILFFQFIWSGTPDPIQLSTIIGDIPQGLNMINIHYFKIYLKIGWIKRFSSNLYGSWQSLLLKSPWTVWWRKGITFSKGESQRNLWYCLSKAYYQNFYQYFCSRYFVIRYFILYSVAEKGSAVFVWPCWRRD